MSSPQVEDIKARIDIVPFIEGYVRLAKAGANCKALCPFHNERTPSFMVSPSRQTWHCFGCGKGGDIFAFLMEIEGLEFPEALKILAERAGIALHREAPQIRSERTHLLSLLEDATRFYAANIRQHLEVGDYLKGRGLTGATAKTFRVGFAEDKWDGLLDYLAGRGYRPQEAERAGLAIKNQNAKIKNQNFGFYDRFRNRIMFPIADSAGRVVGFSGRIYEPARRAGGVEPRKDSHEVQPPTIAAKYINTPQTILYDKSKLLYAFDKAKQEIRKQNACVIVEGQMDALMAHQTGTKNAVAISGTALTPLHLRQIKRLCGSLIFAFDPDTAGMAASRRGLELSYEAGFEGVKIAPLTQGSDPADMIASSPAQWQEAVAGAKESIEFFLDAIPIDVAGAAKDSAAKELFPFLQRIESHMIRAEWLQHIARRLRLPEESIANEFARFLKKNTSPFLTQQSTSRLEPSQTRPEPRLTRRQILEERLFGLLFLYPHLASSLHLELNRVSSYHSPYSAVFLMLLAQEKKLSEAPTEAQGEASRFMTAIEKEGLFTKEDDARREIIALAGALETEVLKEQLTEVRMALAEAERQGNNEDRDRFLHQFSHLIKTYEEKEKTT